MSTQSVQVCGAVKISSTDCLQISQQTYLPQIRHQVNDGKSCGFAVDWQVFIYWFLPFSNQHCICFLQATEWSLKTIYRKLLIIICTPSLRILFIIIIIIIILFAKLTSYIKNILDTMRVFHKIINEVWKRAVLHQVESL